MTNKYVKCTTCDALLAHHLPKTTTAESVTERASKCKPTVRLGAAPVPGKKCTIFHNCRVECIKFPRAFFCVWMCVCVHTPQKMPLISWINIMRCALHVVDTSKCIILTYVLFFSCAVFSSMNEHRYRRWLSAFGHLSVNTFETWKKLKYSHLPPECAALVKC